MITTADPIIPLTMPQTLTLEERVSHVERGLAKLMSQGVNPWLDGAGMFRDDPLFDDWSGRSPSTVRRPIAPPMPHDAIRSRHRHDLLAPEKENGVGSLKSNSGT